jgi:AcrR family transcriptional regulator
MSAPKLSVRATPPAGASNGKVKILRVAERLFADHGFHGVSIRDIAAKAGSSLALVGYHFPNKQELYNAVFMQRKDYIDQRLAALAVARQNPHSRQTLEDIITAFVEPVMRLGEHADGHRFLTLVARGLTDSHREAQQIIAELYDPLAHAFIDALTEAMPGVRRGTVAWCYQFALAALLSSVTDTRVERLSRGENRVRDVATAGPLLIRFLVEGFRGACKNEMQKPAAKNKAVKRKTTSQRKST